MTVLKGEGKVPILFGTKSISAGSTIHDAYLARPDLTGEWPTVLLVPSAWGVTSAAKDLSRRLARQGIAVVVVDVYRGAAPDRDAAAGEADAALAAVPAGRAERDLRDLIGYITNPAGFWSNAEAGFGIIGIGGGGRPATSAAVESGSPLILVGAPLAAPDLARLAAPILGIYGKSDESVSIEEIMAARERVPRAEWVLYDGVGRDFLDDYLDAFDADAHEDALDRITAFFETHLPAVR